MTSWLAVGGGVVVEEELLLLQDVSTAGEPMLFRASLYMYVWCCSVCEDRRGLEREFLPGDGNNKTAADRLAAGVCAV